MRAGLLAAVLGRVEDRREDRRTRVQATRVFGILLVAGSVLALVETLAPPLSPPLLIGMAVATGVIGLVMLTGLQGRVSLTGILLGIWAVQLFTAVGLVIQGEVDDNLRTFFVWFVPYVAFFYGRRATVHLVTYIALVTAVGFSMIPARRADALLAWLATVFLASMVALFVDWALGLLRRSEADQRAASLHDALTGLGNRVEWAEQVALARERMAEEGGRLIVLLVDHDDFNLVNDSHGHEYGDEQLRQVAPRLLESVRSQDTVVRLGGDEFAILCHDVHGDLVPSALADRLLRRVSEPYHLSNERQVFVGGSAGVVVTDSVIDDGDLLRDADAAMYEAKRLGRNQFQLFDDSMRRAAQQRHNMLSAMRDDLSAGRFTAVFQPVYAATDLELVLVEALCRWDSATWGDVPPEEFIPLAESSGLIGQLTTEMLEQALQSMATWRLERAVSPRTKVSVNVSVRDLSEGLAGRVLAACAAARVPTSALALEVTESALMEAGSAPVAVDELSTLRAAGVWIVLDDFGSGYSSLSYLRTLPLDCIKLDRAFLPVDGDPNQWEVIEALLQIARALGLSLIAEGVETEEQAYRLRQLGCRLVQGFLFSPPMAASAIGRPATAPVGSPDDDVLRLVTDDRPRA